MHKDSRIYVTGHRGLVGSAIVRRLRAAGFSQILTIERAELDLARSAEVESFFRQERPEYVLNAAAKVGGIWANFSYPADFLRENLLIQANIIHAAYLSGVARLMLLGSSCIYPKFCSQPIKEEELLTGLLEPTNEAYAIAKIAAIKMGDAYRRQYGLDCISLMPTNLYGPNDNFDPETSHVLPALISTIHKAKTAGAPFITVWGSGSPRREFLHVNDLAEACVFLMKRQDVPQLLNVGTGKDISIRELAVLIGEIVGFNGEIRYDASKPDGTPRKLLDVTRLHGLGWTSRISLRDGIQQTYEWFVQETGSELGRNIPKDGGVKEGPTRREERGKPS